MKLRKRGRLEYLHFFLFIYIIIQLGWWAYLISSLTKIVYAGDERLSQKIWMVWGEGLVFAIILLIGFILTYKSYLRELLAARQQRNFLLSVTHEFKTPISTLRLIIETLQNREMPEEKKTELMKTALADIDRLNLLAENILLATQMDTGSYPIYRTENDLSSYLKKQIEKLQTVFIYHKLIPEIENNIQFSFDELAVTSIISNLIENAVKYSQGGSSITIALQKKPDAILLEVKDEGPGIPPASQKIIFDRFVRLESEDTRSTKGTGLGLFIVKYFVEKHNGKIFVRNNSPKGSVFSIKFAV